ncbi:MAG: NCS2 family permease [Natronomonas sp.]
MPLTDTLADYFEFEAHGTDLRTEVLAGLTTFLAMSYIIVVNGFILAEAIEIPGREYLEVVQMIAIVTILASFVGIMVMAFYANRPFGLAPGMGLNAFFAFTVVLGMGIPWQTALAAVFVEGIIFIAITAVGARQYIIELFPEPVKFSVGAGIGVFLLFIGLQEMEVIVADEATYVALGNVAANPVALLGLGGVLLTFMLWARGIRGSIVIGILVTTLASWILTLAGFFERGTVTPEGLVNAQYDITPLVGAFVEGLGDIEPLTFTLVVFTFFFVDFFDTAGTLIGVSQFGGFLDDEGNLPEVNKPLMADAVGTTVGSILGTSTVTTYIESSTGIEEGGRTGMTAFVVGIFFLLSLVLVPVIAAIPAHASFLALVIVGIIMLQGVLDVDWQDPAWAVAGGLTITIMPLTYSIANGLAAGIISYPIIKSAMGDYDEVGAGQWVIAFALLVYFYVQTSGMFF